MEAKRCPNCREPKVVPAHPYSVHEPIVHVSPRAGGGFRSVGPIVSTSLECCLACGHLWTTLKPEQVRILIEAHNTDLGRQYIRTVLEGPYHDLPDHPAAREAAERVAEIDALVMARRDGEAIRRYRELTGLTWDQAILETRRWANHDRATKLALFGWHPKEKADAKGDELSAHPMRDRWLDD